MAHLAKSIKLCYTYDVLNRVTKHTKKSLTDDTVLSEENFTYDAAGNVTSANGETAQYSLNNRIMVFNGSGVGCDADGNLNSINFDGGRMNLTYDSKNRLTSAGGHTYTYDAEDVRIRNLCGDVDTTYAYDTNGKLSRLLMKTTNGVTTKYVYGLGLIGEQTGNSFKYYHFDSRGSTVALTGGTGIVMDTFEYDTYGKVTARTGNTDVIFGYNGRYGVVTDANGLLYMRARYYSSEMKRFVNADILPGGISDAITLNRYAYANGNPVSFVDPFGLKGMSNHHERVGDYFPNSSAEQIHLIDEQLNALAGLTQSTDANSKTQADSTLSLLADDIYGDGNFYQAVLVVRFKDEGLSLVGHTQLYFRSDKDKWYYTEYTTSGGRNVKEKMKNAQVYYRERIPPVFDPKSGTFINADGCDYVVLNGDFNESKALAEKYYIEQSFGKYDFFFHNCSDYTDEILDHAHIDGYYSQLMLDGDSLISVPALRVQEAKLWGNVDSSIECITPLIEEAKERIAEAAKEKMAEVANYVLDLLRP